MVIQHNLEANNTNRVLGSNLGKQSKVLEKLSSGYKINRAGDNAAGLSISEKMRAQIRGLSQASRNIQDGISLIQTAEGALNEVHSMVQRIRELSVQAVNATNAKEEQGAIQEEINNLIKGVDEIATTTSFNGTKLLDGSLKGNGTESLSLNDILNSKDSGMKIIYVENSFDFATEQSGAGKATIPGYDSLKNVLKTEIVPNAVKSIVDAYSSTFGYLNDSAIGIGLELYTEDSDVLASVGCSLLGNSANYRLSVNMSALSFEGDELTEDSRRKLETTIVHEMMHAFMDETLTNGMMGFSDGRNDSSNEFPLWFIEGMAQTAAGGYSNDNDWINRNLRILSDTGEDEISRILKHSTKNLASNSNSGNYGTGYLACMYLGYLESGTSDITANSLAAGVDGVLKKLQDGKSLNGVINEVSGGKYTSISDFQSKFGDADSANFVYRLTALVGEQGNGGLVSRNLTDSDLLPNSTSTTQLFLLDTTNESVKNIYPTGTIVLEGGGSKVESDGTITDVPSNPGIPFDPISPGGAVEVTGGMRIQTGSNQGQYVTIKIDSVTSKDLGIDSILVTSKEGAEESIDKCDKAIKKISTIRSTLGAYQNRLEYAKSSVDNSEENTQSAESRIRDADMADEMMKYSKFNILVQAAQAMLSQSNQSKQSVLRLLQ